MAVASKPAPTLAAEWTKDALRLLELAHRESRANAEKLGLKNAIQGAKYAISISDPDFKAGE